MKHNWEHKNPAPGTKYFIYFGCHDLRKCKNCGAIQRKDAEYEWGRVIGYSWWPKVGKCKGIMDDEQFKKKMELITTLPQCTKNG